MLFRQVTDEGLDFVKRWEGYSSKTYVCPGGWRTIGWGHALTPGEAFADGITEEEAGHLLDRDLDSAEQSVGRLITVDLNDDQFNALTSFAFNLGGGALQRSTLRAVLNRGDYMAAANELLKWNRASGKRSRGLTFRRAAERAMFLRE